MEGGPAGKADHGQDITPRIKGTNTDPNGSTDFDSRCIGDDERCGVFRRRASSTRRVVAQRPRLNIGSRVATWSYDSDRMRWDFPRRSPAAGSTTRPGRGLSGAVGDQRHRAKSHQPREDAGRRLLLGESDRLRCPGAEGREPWVADTGGPRVLGDLQPGARSDLPAACSHPVVGQRTSAPPRARRRQGCLAHRWDPRRGPFGF